MKQQVKISRSEVLTIAHQIRREENSLTWGQCQAAAWKSLRLRSALRTGVVSFSYTKENGEVRQASGTLNASLFQYESKGTTTAPKAIIVKYFDFEANAWRSCRADRLIAA